METSLHINSDRIFEVNCGNTIFYDAPFENGWKREHLKVNFEEFQPLEKEWNNLCEKSYHCSRKLRN